MFLMSTQAQTEDWVAMNHPDIDCSGVSTKGTHSLLASFLGKGCIWDTSHPSDLSWRIPCVFLERPRRLRPTGL